MSKVDYLSEDNFLPSGQSFVCISFLSDPKEKSNLVGIKIRGVFATYDAAREHCKKIQSIDPYFNVFVGEMGKWLPFNPSPDSDAVKESEYANDQLNNMMKSYLENQEKAKVYHEQRKTEQIRQNILDNLEIKQQNLNEIETKIKTAKENNEKIDNLEDSVKVIEEQIKKMELRKNELDQELNNYNNEMKKFSEAQMNPAKVINIE